MTQKFAIPAFFGNPSPTAFSNPNRIHYDTLKQAPLPAESIIVLDMGFQDISPRPVVTDTALVTPFADVAQTYRNLGYIVVGYVSTTLGTGANCPPGSKFPPWVPFPNTSRQEPSLKNYVDYWYAAIPQLDGIFFDEGPTPEEFTGGPTTGTTIPIAECVKRLYSNMYQYVQTKPVRMGRPAVGGNLGPAVLLNASQYQEDPAGEWIMVGDQNVQPHLSKACDVALLFETSACRYFVTEPIAPPNLTTNVWPVPPPNWWTTYALQRVAHTIYASHNAEDMRRVIALSNQRGPAAGYMFVVDSESAIYSHLPPYWTEELAAITAPPGTATAEQRSNAISKFYVRDWTDTRTIYDTGQEPSTHAFWITSDVWNRQTNSSGADPLNPTKFSGNDQPPSEDIQVGTTLPIPNFAFVRIHRQYACAGTPAATVPATFLWADFGTGTNFQDVSSKPTEQVGFASGDVRKINFGVEWTLPAANSGHICLAVEIDTGQDPLKVELKGRSTSDVDSLSLVVKDNNLAQRNLAAVAVANLKGNLPAEGLLPFCFYGIAHNGDIFPRTMVLRCELAEEVQGILGDAFVEVIEGSDEPTSRSCKLGGTIMLEDMQPGENRWIGLSAQLRGGDEGQLLPVSFRELINDEVVNGFTIAVKPAVLSTVMLDNLNLQATEFYRLADTFGIESAEEVSEAALEVFRKSEELTSDAYLEFLQSYLALMSEGIDDWVRSQDVGDPFGIRAALEQLTEGFKSDDIAFVTATHNCALQKLDAFITMRQKAQGDDADILQMVRWQQRLYSRQPLEALEGVGQIVEESEKFVDAYQAREIGNDEYPRLIDSLLNTFRQTSEVGIDLEKDTTAMQQCMQSTARLQKAHREYLLKLQYLLKLKRLGIKI